MNDYSYDARAAVAKIYVDSKNNNKRQKKKKSAKTLFYQLRDFFFLPNQVDD